MQRKRITSQLNLKKNNRITNNYDKYATKSNAVRSPYFLNKTNMCITYVHNTPNVMHIYDYVLEANAMPSSAIMHIDSKPLLFLSPPSKEVSCDFLLIEAQSILLDTL